MLSALKQLAKMKGLRGTALDVFGKTEEREMECTLTSAQTTGYGSRGTVLGNAFSPPALTIAEPFTTQPLGATHVPTPPRYKRRREEASVHGPHADEQHKGQYERHRLRRLEIARDELKVLFISEGRGDEVPYAKRCAHPLRWQDPGGQRFQ
jgi:hypothetical protein